MTVQDPLHGNAICSHGISVEDKAVTQKLMCRLVHPFNTLELAIYRTKRGRVELLWPIISYRLHQFDQYPTPEH